MRPFLLDPALVLEGDVLRGAQLGRTIGFPTANMVVTVPWLERGIYAAYTRLADGRVHPGIAYFGRRPTVHGLDEQLETHLFGVDEDLYGQRLTVELIGFMRPDMTFASLDAMVVRMRDDRLVARAMLTGVASQLERPD